VPNPCARPNQQQFTSRLDRKSTCVDADNNRFGRRGNGASRISALFPAAAAKILSPPVVFFAEVEKHATRSLAQMQRKATLSRNSVIEPDLANGCCRQKRLFLPKIAEQQAPTIALANTGRSPKSRL
jgi:hypothetical protein